MPPDNEIKQIICLANSRRPGGCCVAGKEKLENGYGGWIRPVNAAPKRVITTVNSQYENKRLPKLLDILEIPVVMAERHEHHTENYVIDPGYYWNKIGRLAWAEAGQLIDRPSSLWRNGDSSYSGSNDRVLQKHAIQMTNSLALIKPQEVQIQVCVPGAAFENPKRRVKTHFKYNNIDYMLWVADPSAENAFLQKENGTYTLNNVYFCISLAEAHTDGYCYKLVAGIISREPL